MEKKRHTVKSLLLTNKEKRILYVSELYQGSVHDYHLLEDCFSPELSWFKQKIIPMDLGFQGKICIAVKRYIYHIRKRDVQKEKVMN